MKITIKRFVLAALLMAASAVSASPVFNMPVVRIQPNGDTLHCFVSGDEFYHRLHDADDYTIVQNPRNGYWVFADTVHTGKGRWQVVPTQYVAGVVNPHTIAGLHPHLGVDRETWLEKQKLFDVPKGDVETPKTSGTNHGQLNNVVIFVRFSDETEITTPFSNINAMFNDSSATSTSMYSYFKKVSYNKINIVTHYYPTPSGNTVVSYQDSLPRSYYQPYDSTTNTNGYQTDDERRVREFSLLERAVNYVNANSPVPSTLNIDMDNDGYVDNICFVVKGTYTGWSDLLWPHKWSLWDRQVYINGKRVYTFNLQLEGSGEHYFSSSTFCHEMFHTLGAPDLYRYYEGTNVSGVGSWDLMCSNTTPPQHMSAYMKWKYGNWLDSIPQITIPGTYTLHSLGDDTYENCCYKIAAQEPHQWYVLEYRDNTERFETGLPGKGLLVFRIDDRYSGNASFDGVSTFDEVYLFRPNAADDSTNGTPSQAYFSGSTSRTSFTPQTNPHPWLTGNVIDTTFALTNITVPGTTISFTYMDLRGCVEPHDLSVSSLTGHSATLSWAANSGSSLLQWRASGSATVNSTVVAGHSYPLNNLQVGTEYQWRVKGICGVGDSSAFSSWTSFTTASCYEPLTTAVGTAETTYYNIPVNNYYNYTYSQMIYTAAEMGGPMEITSLSFNYAGASASAAKTNCTIYLGTTTQSTFAGPTAAFLVPLSQLQKVYEGPLACVQGWNEFVLDSAFTYNGTGNLVVAIDDNSCGYNGTSYRFYCTSTSQYTSLTFCSDSENPDPTSMTDFSGYKNRLRYRPDIRFKGCPFQVLPTYEVTVTSSNSSQGSVSGGDTYDENATATITATPAQHYHFLYWISGSDTITDNPYTFTVTEDASFTAYFALDSHHVSVASNDTTIGRAWFTYATGEALNEALLPYGTVLSLHAEARTDVDGYQCTFLHWSDGNTQADRTLTLAQDIQLTALFEAQPIQGIQAATDPYRVVVRDGGIEIAGATGAMVALYDAIGRCHWRSVADGQQFIPVSHAGVYLLRINGQAHKVVVHR